MKYKRLPMQKFGILLFLRTRILLCFMLVGYIFIHAYMMFFQGSLVRGNVLLYINRTQSVGFIAAIMFSFISYEFFQLERNAALEETVQTSKKMKRNFVFTKLSFLIVMVTLVTLTVFVYDLSAVMVFDIASRAVIVHLVLCSLLNIFFCCLIAMLLGALLGLKTDRPKAYAVLIVFVFLLSPQASLWFTYLKIPFDEIEIDFSRIMDFFSITALDTDFVPDDLYGLPIEACRWGLACFWIAVLSLLFFRCVKLPWEKRKNRILPISCGVAAAIGFVFFARMGNDSVVRLDERHWGTNYADAFYEELHSAKEEEADFTVLAYDLDVSVKTRLYCTAKITVSGDEDTDEYIFTLYRGYKIASVTDEDGNDLSYTRDGHYLSVSASFPEGTGVICVTYQGSGNRYYSNRQGIALPGYFPWYPVAGYRSLDIADHDTLLELAASEEEKKFTISLDTNLTVVSNLTETSEGVYDGTAGTATLIGGFLTEKEQEGVTYYDSPFNFDTLQLEEMQAVLEAAEETLDTSFDLDFRESLIICMPGVISRTASERDETFVVLDNCILLDTNIVLSYRMMDYLIPDKEEAEELREFLLEYLVWPDSDPIYCIASESYEEKPEYDALAVLKADYVSADDSYEMTEENWYYLHEAVEEDSELWNEAMVYFEELFLYQIQRLGYDTVMKACYEYMGSDTDTDQVDFLYNLSSD